MPILTSLLAFGTVCSDIKSSYRALECCSNTPLNAVGADGTYVTNAPCPVEIATYSGTPVPTGANQNQGCIYLGSIGDFTGFFQSSGSPLEMGQRMFWKAVNEKGGIVGKSGTFSVCMRTAKDNGFDLVKHEASYDALRDNVFALTQSMGIYPTLNVLPKMVEDSMLAVPMAWYTVFSDESVDKGMILEFGASYYSQGSALVKYFLSQSGGAGSPSFGFAGYPGFGGDMLDGVLAELQSRNKSLAWSYTPSESFNITNVFTQAPVDYLILAVMPMDTAQIVGTLGASSSTTFGLTSTSYDEALIADTSPVAPLIETRTVLAYPTPAYTFDSKGHSEMRSATSALPKHVGLLGGWVSQYALYATLSELVASGLPMSRSNHKALSAGLTVNSDGMMPSYNLNVGRSQAVFLYRPSIARGEDLLSTFYSSTP